MIKSFDTSKYSYTSLATQFKKYVNHNNCPEIFVDMSSFNIIDAIKFILFSSAYHYSKYPSGKFKCHIASDDVKDYIQILTTSNLELV